jgi:beta-glucosidase/6-phospho-beta-glucosidase/beta-galactosidase
VERSGRAVDFWNRFEEDFDRAEMMGMTSYRLGIEWARLQPDGPRQELVPAALDRYAEMVAGLRRRDLEPLITLQHFTTPRWLGLDPWLEEGTPEVFSSYVCTMLRGLNRRLEEKGVAPPRWFITVNEPNMLASSTYNLGAFPAGRRAWWAAALCALQTMLDSHVVVRRQVHALYAEHPAWGRPMLSFNTFASDLYWMDKMLFDVLEAARQTRGKEPILAYLNERAREFTRAYRSMDFPRHSLFSEAAGELIKQIQNSLSHRFLRETTFSKLDESIRERPREGNLDFISFDYYDPFVGNAVRLPTPGELRLGRLSLREWFTQGLATKWWDWHALPRGLRFFVERYAADYPDLPIVIAENGMAERRCGKENQDCELRGDRQSRSYFIRQHVGEVQRLRKEGFPLAGYFHWSLTDNYEWGSFSPRFGLYRIDFQRDLARLEVDHLGDRPSQTYARLVREMGLNSLRVNLP